MTNKKLNLFVASDNGNSEHDIIISNSDDENDNGVIICQPNVYREYEANEEMELDGFDIEDMISDIENSLFTTITSPALGNKERRFCVGQFALVHSSSAIKTTNLQLSDDSGQAKLDSDIPVVNTLSQIAGYAVKTLYTSDVDFQTKVDEYIEKIECYGEDDIEIKNYGTITYEDELNVNVDLATSIPANVYKKFIARQYSNRFMNGPHTVIVHAGLLNFTVNIDITFAYTMSEGVTGVYALQTADDSLFEEHNEQFNDNLTSDSFVDKTILHVAIGDGTTDCPITKGLVPVPTWVTGCPNGVGVAIDTIKETLSKVVRMPNLKRQKISDFVKNPESKYHNKTMEILSPALKSQAELILPKVKEQIINAQDCLDFIAVYGGGSITMKEFILPALRADMKEAGYNVFYVPEEYAVTLESQGLYAFVTSQLFTELKEKHLNKKKTKEIN